MKAEREYIMSETARLYMREYQKEWRAKHPERAREIQREYLKRKGERKKAEQGDGKNEKA